MALQKSITLPNGATGNYLKVTRFAVDKQTDKLTVELSLFADAAHSNGEPLKKAFKSFVFQSDKATLAGNIIALAYSNIKAKNEADLSGATDV